eukprot:GHVH01007764.1.p1 GENE.GHVH01007764.1~~GHVH01007764.1.p1  ORF type:complete len:433 (+),score=28.74 GHVH01007764.1:328-1626(+)
MVQQNTTGEDDDDNRRRSTMPGDGDSQQHKVTPDISIDVEKRFRTMAARWISAFSMIFAFLFIIKSGTLYVGTLILIIVVGMYRDVASIKRNKLAESWPWYFTLRYFWMAIFLFSSCHVYLPMLGDSLDRELTMEGLGDTARWMVGHKNIIFWSLTFLGIVSFVLSLSRYSVKYQFTQFFCLLFPCMFFAQVARGCYVVLFAGMYWMLLGFGSAICNDCWAYVFGVNFGRHRLLAISPCKTWEGYIGAFFATVLYCVLCAHFASSIPGYLCPQSTFYLDPRRSFDSHLQTCDLSNHMLTTKLYVVDAMQFGVWRISMTPVMLHSIVLALFASFGAPFGGFFASGLKRAAGIKDFGHRLGSHGGWFDRFDCQCCMALFLRVYIEVIMMKGISQAGVLEGVIEMAKMLPKSEQLSLITTLMNGDTGMSTAVCLS